MPIAPMNTNINAIIARNQKHAEKVASSNKNRVADEQVVQSSTLAYHDKIGDDIMPPPPYHEVGHHSIRPCRSTMQFGHRVCTSNRERMADLMLTSTSVQPQCPAYLDEMPGLRRGVEASKSPFMLDLIVGQSMAKKITKERDLRRQQRLEKVHDAWLKLGLDTRRIVADGCLDRLPPHFWSPPRYDAEEMNRRLRGLGI